MISLNVNGKDYKADVPADASLLWVLRDHLKLTVNEVQLRNRRVRRMYCPRGWKGREILWHDRR